MNSVFVIVARLLEWVARLTGLTYNEINIVAYYMVLPFVYIALLDRIIGKHFLKASYVCVWILGLVLMNDFTDFSDTLFQGSVDFLLSFGIVGLDYIEASVVICVILPGLALLVLSMYAFPSFRAFFFIKYKGGIQTPQKRDV